MTFSLPMKGKPSPSPCISFLLLPYWHRTLPVSKCVAIFRPLKSSQFIGGCGGGRISAASPSKAQDTSRGSYNGNSGTIWENTRFHRLRGQFYKDCPSPPRRLSVLLTPWLQIRGSHDPPPCSLYSSHKCRLLPVFLTINQGFPRSTPLLELV